MLIRLFQQYTTYSVRAWRGLRFPRSLREFQRQFASEEACQAYLATCRWPEGFKCPQCGHQRAYIMTRLWQCAGCRHRVSVTSGTILHNQSIVGVVVLGGVPDDDG